MNTDQLKKIFGEEYPAAVIQDGIRLPLWRESRFMRSYHSKEHKLGSEVSRFMDGSASITVSELQHEWHTWTESTRMDFCSSCAWLDGQADFPEMLRFIMQHADPDEWSGLANSVAAQLPRDEAFDILTRVLRSVEIGHTANIAQAIALTKHPEAEATLRQHLFAVWAHTGIWDEDKFLNWVAFDATTCIEHLLELGASPVDFEDNVRRLAEHACPGNRDSCRNYLSKYYEWLKV